ncbi:MAG: hypothetical protein ABI821_04705 [Pseudomonadota bacterium]
MDARDLSSRPTPVSRHLARIAVFVLAAMIALALWRGYGVLLLGNHVH